MPFRLPAGYQQANVEATDPTPEAVRDYLAWLRREVAAAEAYLSPPAAAVAPKPAGLTWPQKRDRVLAALSGSWQTYREIEAKAELHHLTFRATLRSLLSIGAAEKSADGGQYRLKERPAT